MENVEDGIVHFICIKTCMYDSYELSFLTRVEFFFNYTHTPLYLSRRARVRTYVFSGVVSNEPTKKQNPKRNTAANVSDVPLDEVCTPA